MEWVAARKRNEVLFMSSLHQRRKRERTRRRRTAVAEKEKKIENTKIERERDLYVSDLSETSQETGKEKHE